MKINPSIFREYDIRGVVDKDYDKEFAESLGRAYACVLAEAGGKRATVGRDCRLSSPGLAEALIRGLTSSGVDVIDIGIVTTPMHYFSLFKLDVDGGIMVSGSHNPPDQNGFKISLGKETLHGDDIRKFRPLIESGKCITGQGSLSEQSINQMYIDYVVDNISLKRPLKVVVDAGNGTAGPIAPEVIRRLGCEVTELYTDMDGNFPNHHPDPTVAKNVQELIAKVREQGADVGIGYDGDSDRIGVVDDQGNIIWGDILLILLSRAVLKEVPGATVIAEVKCTHRLYNDITKHGGKGIMWKAGHSLIKAKMKDEGAALGGEMSGHIFYQHRWLGFDDAIYTSCRLLELMTQSDVKLSQMLSDIPPAYSTPEIRIESSDERKFDIVSRVTQYFKDQGHEVVDVDGVRLLFPDGWGLVRASNTQPMLVMRFEAESEARRDEIQKLVRDKVDELNK